MWNSIISGRFASSVSPFDHALNARLALARYRLLGEDNAKQEAITSAHACGYATHPNEWVSPLIQEAPELADAWKAGWDKRAYDTRPLTEDDLQGEIKKMCDEANKGCGLFYELFLQNFTRLVDEWLPSLRDNERAIALEMLKEYDYPPEGNGTWVYDPEENDIRYVGADNVMNES